MDSSPFVVPVECDADVFLARPVGCDLVLLIVREDAHKMMDVLFPYILYTEIVHDEGERDWPRHMRSQARNLWALKVVMRVETLL